MERIAHYRLIRQIGSGGMGKIFAAADEHLDRTVALKILASDMASDPQRLQRFETEARAAASLIHPNIAQVYETGGNDGARFIAMELIEGETLEQRIARAELNIREIVGIGEELVEAVAEAHRLRIIHRDIKPTNVMLTPSGHVKVLDFGLARMDGPAAPMERTQWVTDAGVVMGTPDSMSPEQALGRRGDERSDIFSVGVVLYMMVTRRMPFRGANTIEVLQKVINAHPEPMARFNYELPEALETIIRKCLEKEPERRYQSAAELLVDLRNLARDLASQSSPAAERFSRGKKLRSRMAWAAGITVLLVALLVQWQQHRPRGGAVPAVESIAVFPFVIEGGVESDEYFRAGLTENTISALSLFPGLRVTSRSTVFNLGRTAKSPLEAARRLRVDALVTGVVRRENGSLVTAAELVRTRDGSVIRSDRFSRPDTESGLVHRDIVQMVAAGLGMSGLEDDLARYGTLDSEAYKLYLEAVHHWQQRSEAGLRRAIDLFEEAVRLDPQFAPAWAGLANSYSVLERYAGIPGAEVKLRARVATRRALRLGDRLPEAHVAHASYQETFDWDWKGAEEAYRTAIELGGSHSTAYHWKAMLLTRLGRHREAIEDIAMARQLDPMNPLVAAAAGNVHYYAGNYLQSEEECVAALALDPSSGLARVQLGLSLTFGGNPHRAIEELQAAVKETAGNPVIQLQAMAALAVSHAAAGESAEARRIVEGLEQLPRASLFGYGIAAIHAMLGDHEAAFLWLGRALESSSFWLSLLGVEPAFASIRSDPRFELMLERVGLPPGEEFGWGAS
jgi:eukaryotic-like serine/threonine-protein kinase